MLYGFRCTCQNIESTANNDKEKVLEIIYDESAGEGGQCVFKTTKDSIFYFSWSPRQKIEKKEKNTDKAWSMLIRSVDLKRFDNIISDKSERELDGGDTYITIQTTKKKHFLIISTSKNYKPIKSFLNNLLKEMQHFDSNVNREYYQ